MKRSALKLLVFFLLTPACSVLADGLEKHPRVVDAIALLDLWIEERRAYQDLPGLSIGVVHDQHLIWAKGYGASDVASQTPATPGTVYRVGSITKLFTATAILQLRDRGKLRLDDPVVEHLPWFRVQGSFVDAPEITLRHLLTHTSGLPREAAFPYWTDHIFPNREQLIAMVPTQSAIFAPATTYKYSNLGIALLGEIVATVSGQPYAEYLSQHVFGPLGMSHTAVVPNDELNRLRATSYMRRMPDGRRGIFEDYDTEALRPAANIVSTVEDLARFAALHLSEGSDTTSAQVLKGSTVREMQRPHWVFADWSGGRGLGFAISRRNGKTFVSHGGWVGGNRSHFLLVPSEKIAVIVMINADDGSPSDFSYQAYGVLAPALAKATAKEPEPRRADAAWQRYVGTYSDPWGWEYKVLILDDTLVFYEHNYPPEEDPRDALTRLEPVAEHVFRMGDGELVTFELGTGGRVTRLKRRYDYLFPLEESTPAARQLQDPQPKNK